jgi:hypothetical protein
MDMDVVFCAVKSSDDATMSGVVLEFIGSFRKRAHDLSEDDIARLADRQFRDAVYHAIYAANDPADRSLIIALLQHEMQEHRGGPGFNTSLLFCAFLLAIRRDVRDVLLIWEAKNVSFDTLCGLDVQLLVLAGPEETLRFLRADGSDAARAAVAYIEQGQAAGDFRDLEGYLAFCRKYLGLSA